MTKKQKKPVKRSSKGQGRRKKPSATVKRLRPAERPDRVRRRARAVPRTIGGRSTPVRLRRRSFGLAETVLLDGEISPIVGAVPPTYRSVVQLTAYQAGRGPAFLGTGFLISPCLVLTAAHCIYNPAPPDAASPGFGSANGGYAGSVVVRPLYVDGRAPQKIASKEVLVHLDYLNAPTPRLDRDFGVVLLGNLVTAPGVSIARLSASLASDLINREIASAGYPVSVGQDTMYGGTGRVADVRAGRLFHTIRTQIGQSGSPLLFKTDKGLRSVSVHNAGREKSPPGLASCASGSLITPDIVAWLAPMLSVRP